MLSIKKVKQIREDLNLTHIIIFGIAPDQEQIVATHGMSKVDAEEAAEMGNRLKKNIGWPAKHCNSKPLERTCANCSFWRRKKHDPGYPIPANWSGKCMHDPAPVVRYEEDLACGCFEPNR